MTHKKSGNTIEVRQLSLFEPTQLTIVPALESAQSSPSPIEDSAKANKLRPADMPEAEMVALACVVKTLYEEVGQDRTNKSRMDEFTLQLATLRLLGDDLMNLMDEERLAGHQRPDLVDKAHVIGKELDANLWDFLKFAEPLAMKTSVNPFAIPEEDLALITMSKELKATLGILDDPDIGVDMDLLNALRPKVWSFITRTQELEEKIGTSIGLQRRPIREILEDIENAVGFDLATSREWMKYVLIRVLLPSRLRTCIKLDFSGPYAVMLFENAYGLRLDLQLTAAGDLLSERVNIVVIRVKEENYLVQCENAPIPEKSITIAELPEVCERLMKLGQAKTPVEAQVKEFRHNLAYFTGTENWTRLPTLCKHIVLLTDGVQYIAEHGGEDGNGAFWLIDAIASYQGETILRGHDFQRWKLSVLPPDPPEPELPSTSVGAVLKSKLAGVQLEPNPHRHAVLTCVNGSHELVRQEIEYTDFLPIGEIEIYASIEKHPDISASSNVMILLLPSEY